SPNRRAKSGRNLGGPGTRGGGSLYRVDRRGFAAASVVPGAARRQIAARREARGSQKGCPRSQGKACKEGENHEGTRNPTRVAKLAPLDEVGGGGRSGHKHQQPGPRGLPGAGAHEARPGQVLRARSRLDSSPSGRSAPDAGSLSLGLERQLFLS